MATKQTASSLRKNVYDYLALEGFRLSMKQQQGLSAILKSVYENRTIETTIEHMAPVVRQAFCPNCLQTRTIGKNTLQNYRKKIKQILKDPSYPEEDAK